MMTPKQPKRIAVEQWVETKYPHENSITKNKIKEACQNLNNYYEDIIIPWVEINAHRQALTISLN